MLENVILEYERKAHYYETDQMGIIHHANYIHWIEEARIEFMEQLGVSYQSLEANGIISPVIGVECDYKTMVKFGDTVIISARIVSYNGIKMEVGYRITDRESGELRAVGKSRHCFLNAEGYPVALKKASPKLHRIFTEVYEAQQSAE